METIICGNVRVQLLSEDIVRIEYAKKGQFCDRDTFFIPNRTRYGNAVAYTQEKDVISFGKYKLYMPRNKQSLSGIRLEKDGKKVYTYKKLLNSGELPPLDKTPEVFAVSDTPRIFIPEGGYSQERKGEYTVEENVQDVFLLLCEKDAKKLRRLYVELTGKNELVRLSTLGGWNSKYYAYTQEGAKQLILDYEAHNVPLDVMVIDTDWRSCEHGWGYDINTKLFPDMSGFLSFAHAHGVEIMFNDHPEPVHGAEIFAPEEIAYREKNLQSLMEKGLDIWWYDRNWGTKLISPSAGIDHETLGLYLFQDITANYYKRQAGSEQIYRRPVIMGNVDNIANGCYLGIADSASHRYSIQWTGDVESTEYALSQEVENLLKCTDNCIPYVNADCGGHTGNPDSEGFIRWMQFGTLSPVFRPHCTNYVERTREPWVYDEETLNIVREYINLRYRLLPVIYKNAYVAYETGEPIFKSAGFEFPKDKRAAERNGKYMLGNNILIAPVAGNYPRPIAKENYLSPVKAVFFNGTAWEGDLVAAAEWDTLNMVLKNASPAKNVPISRFSAKFSTVLQFSKKMRLFVKCNDGVIVWVDGKKVFEATHTHFAVLFSLCDLSENEPHKVEIEYYHSTGTASCILSCAEIKNKNEMSVYLPAGKWLDPFRGKVYNGRKTVCREYALHEMPLFVRLGALIPLAYEAKNTKEQKWDKLVYDFYPCKGARDSGYLYEDDTETTAYKFGQYRKSAYEAYFSEEENAFIIKLHAAEGSFNGERCFANRKITLRYHLLKGAEGVKHVTVNGKETEYIKKKKNKKAFPLNTGTSAPDSGVVLIPLETDVSKEYEVKIYL